MVYAQDRKKITNPLNKRATVILLVCIYGVAMLERLYLTSQPPINSTDMMRFMGYGKEFWKYGLSIYNYTPRQFGNTPYSNLWPDLQFIYPAVAMLFYGAVARIWPSLFFARLVLTIVELINSRLIARLTGSQLFGLLYFLNPVSIWWFSREGQYEPIVILLTLLALLNLATHPAWGYAWLGLAIQAKYWPGVLLPYFLSRNRKWQSLIIFCLVFIPSILFTVFSDYIFHIIGSPNMAAGCNPFFWNIFDDSITCWTPMWHLTIYAVATYGMLLVTLIGMVQDQRNSKILLTYAGILMFIVYYKSINWAAAWYLPLFIVFAFPIQRPWIRWTIFFLSLAEPIAWAGLFGQPIGWINPEPPFQYIWGGIG